MVIVRGEPSAWAKKRINQNGDKERRRGETKKKVKGNSTDYHERSEGIPSDWIP
jgi:hypothetical protein